MGLAMGLTAIVNIYSPWGRRSGAHLNPAVTLGFFRLGKVHPRDVPGYLAAQFVGAIAGTEVAAWALRAWIAHPAVNYVATVPGRYGFLSAFTAELGISFLLLFAVLTVSSAPRLAGCTGIVAGALVAACIAIEAPISGMSMNPARTLGSAVPAHLWTGWWIYFTAPVLGMLTAAETFRRWRGRQLAHCAKLHHDERVRCVFCEHHRPRPPAQGPGAERNGNRPA